MGSAFEADPSRALADAGLADATESQIAAVAAAAVPEVGLQSGEPITALQNAVATQHGVESFMPPTDSAESATKGGLLGTC